MKHKLQIENRSNFDFIRYSNCWEDDDILCEALNPLPGKRILSIASAGDNTLALAAGGAEILAVDVNLSQIACLELKSKAFQVLSYAQVLEFLGISKSSNRHEFFREIRQHLSLESQRFWDLNQKLISKGFVHCGKFERYFYYFSNIVLPLVTSKQKIAELIREKTLSEREEFYYRHWNTARWKLFFKIFFGKYVMGRVGRDPEFFRYVKGSVDEQILELTKVGLTYIPTHDNPYLHYILYGNYGEVLPRYLRPENFEKVREYSQRITFYRGTIQEALAKYERLKFDAYNLSDIFEYINEKITSDIYSAIISSAKQSARILYWNMLVLRKCPDRYREKVRDLTEISQTLYRKNRAFFYRDLQVQEIVKDS